MHTSLTCIINNRNVLGTEQALVPCQLLNMFQHTFISQLPSLLSRGKEQAMSLFKCTPLPTLLVCLCPETVQMTSYPSFETEHGSGYTLYIPPRPCRTLCAETHPMDLLTQKMPSCTVTTPTHTVQV